MTERMYTLLRAILYLKDVLGSKNIFCKMDSYLKKNKSISTGGKGEVWGKVFNLYLSCKKENR